ncbi:MAG: folate family ECF transporter S component [Acetobacteraceae bacterium]|nr:folate family ECF transporter S component [Acetobacteraceae bacterium]
MKRGTRQLTGMALLIALAVVLTRFASLRVSIGGVEGIRLGFGTLPIVLGGVFYGAWGGALIGAVSDVVGFFLSPMGPYVPHFTLTAALTGFIPGLILRLRRAGPCPGIGDLALAIGVGQVVVALGLIPLFLYQLFRQPYLVNFVPRLVAQAILIPTYVAFGRIVTARTLLLRRASSARIPGE